MVTTTLAISAGVTILIGILILIFPKIIRWAIGLYLIFLGIMQLL